MQVRSLLIFLLTLPFFLTSCLFSPLPFDEKKWLETVEQTDRQDLYAPNLHDGKYLNPWLPQENKSFAGFLRWRFSKAKHYSADAVNYKPRVMPNVINRIQALPADADFIAWIGHASFLLRIAGEYWLTDPIFSQRALLPKRITPPAITAQDLARLSGGFHVLLSHNHYDHLDKDSLKQLPEGTKYFVPSGLKDYVQSFSAGPVVEMNWWDEIRLGDEIAITCLPAQHWSRRIFQGYNTTLWASYMLMSNDRSIYFGGDSGYFKGYREIGRKFKRIDYALLPITAYDPRWFMHYAHMNVEEAVHAFDELGAHYFIPTQWGTFHLGDNPPGLPALDLQRFIERENRNSEKFLLLHIGQIHLL